MQKLINIQKVNDAELKLIKEQSSLLLQKRSNGFNGELKSSGTIIENYVKGLLQKHLPNGYRICSGYIATTDSMQSEGNLVQHDIIIVDGRVPSIYFFGVSDIEVVPAEAVCGIIEIKRTLTINSIRKAISQLRVTKELLDAYRDGVKSKVKAFNTSAGPTFTTHAPLYSIVSLDCSNDQKFWEVFKLEVVPSVHEFIDLIWAPAASFLAVFGIKKASEGEPHFPTYLPPTVSRNWEGYNPDCMYEWFKNQEQARIYGTAISCYRTWITNTSGLQLGVEQTAQYFGAQYK
jgi:hypothetical protein